MNNVLVPEVGHSADNPIRDEADFFHCQANLALIKKVLKSFFRRVLIADHAVRKATQLTKKWLITKYETYQEGA